MMDWQDFLDKADVWLKVSGIKIILIIIGTLVVTKIARMLLNRIFRVFLQAGLDAEMKKRADTLSSLARNIVSTVILGIAFIIILEEFGIDIGPILAAAGIVGLAVGFGAQNLVQDIISGFFILLEDQIRVGDVVDIAGKSGLVEKVTIRMTILRDINGSVHFVRNGKIDVVTNMTKDYAFYLFDIGVAYRENIDEVMKVMRKTEAQLRLDTSLKEDILEPLEIMGLDKFADSAVIIRARLKTKPNKQWRAGREYNRLLKKNFDEAGIEIPFPHLTVFRGRPKEGNTPTTGV